MHVLLIPSHPSSSHLRARCVYYFFFFNDTATTEIYTLSLHDALPISRSRPDEAGVLQRDQEQLRSNEKSRHPPYSERDRKSTRLNSSHPSISYAVFCLKKKTLTNPDISLCTFSDCPEPAAQTVIT